MEQDASKKAPTDPEPPKAPGASPASPGRVEAPRVFAQAKAPLAPKPAIVQRLGTPLAPRAPAVAPKAPQVASVHHPAPSPPAPAVTTGAAPSPAEHHAESPKPPNAVAAMSPVSSPVAFDDDETVQAGAKAEVEFALSSLRSSHRELEARLARLEHAIRDLQLSDQARAATFAASIPTQGGASPPARGRLPTLSMGAGDPVTPAAPAVAPLAPAAIAPPLAPPLAAVGANPVVATAPAPAPVPVQTPPPPALAPSMPVVYSTRPPPLNFDTEPFDKSMLPDGLDGSKRKRLIVTFAVMVAIVGLGGLVAMAIASQAVHGL